MVVEAARAPALGDPRLALVQRRVLRPRLKLVGHADLSTGSRRPVEAVFWAIVSAPTASFVTIVPSIVACAIIVVVATRIPIVAAVALATSRFLAAVSVMGAASVLGAARVLGAASVLARPIRAGSLLVASAVDEVARCGLLGVSGRFVGELPGPLL